MARTKKNPDEVRSVTLQFKVTPPVADLIRRFAAADDRTVSDFLYISMGDLLQRRLASEKRRGHQ